MRAVQIGAGNIGRGFLGQLYFESGYFTTFVDANAELVRLLNERGEYPIEIVEPLSTIRVTNFRAVAAGTEEAVRAIAEADIASTAVGAKVLPGIVPMVLAGLARRDRPLDLILAENLHDAAKHMREWLALTPTPLPQKEEGLIGLVDASVGRMVPVMTEAQKRGDPLKIRVEAFCELPVDGTAFFNPVPPIRNLQPKPNFAAYVERKLYLHNAAHAVAAYLGYQRGYEFIWQAMEDPSVGQTVESAMEEACLSLHRRHGLDLGELREHAADLRRRFSSRLLGDTVARVAADPIRKLHREDRIVGTILMCLEQGVEPPCLVQALRAAIAFDAPNDPSAPRLQALVREKGDGQVLAEVCGLTARERQRLGLDSRG